jgi:alkylation response protein AidB-like acyl-CoA dehydrogenase
VAIARYTAAEGSHRVLATAQHLHGGMGFDRDYALHRYFLTAKAWEFVGGGASAQLARLGALLAASPGQSPS